MNLLVILEYNQNNKRPREERKRKKKEKGSRTGRAGTINDFQRKEAIINQLFGFICGPISVKSRHGTAGRPAEDNVPGGAAITSSARLFSGF